MEGAVWFFLGAFVGVALASAVWSRYTRRTLNRVRAAERRARAAERMAEVGAMTGGLAHEIKNPLSTIGLNAQLLGEAVGELNAPREEKDRLSRRVDALRREADRLRGILTDFLEYAGALRIDPQRSDLNAAVGEMVDFFMPQAERGGVKLVSEPAPGPLTAMVDVAAFKQALLNLMLNAVQAMGSSGRGVPRLLTVRTRAGRDAEGRQASVVEVVDTGPGMPPEVLSKVFEPYFTTKPGGTGLGLPTTRRLIEAHGGRVEVSSEPGRGTTFRLVLPSELEGEEQGPGGAGRAAMAPSAD
ncbi:MAG: two-component sensor histidine kinase [Phycisphaeraceae bacterium]|nr:MAG: two-component sensor histidine kinase [Phycisphaeraceae bacterium]